MQNLNKTLSASLRIIIGSDRARRPETKQGIEGKIDRFRSGRIRVRDRVRVRYNRRSEPNTVPSLNTIVCYCLPNSDVSATSILQAALKSCLYNILII